MAKRTTRLMVLGVIVYRQPISGYGIEKVFDEWAIERWTTVAPASIYHQLASLSRLDLIQPAEPETAGRAAAYRATGQGEGELRRLLLDLLDEGDPRPFSLTPLLYFMPSLTRRELVEGITARAHTMDAHVQRAAEMERRSERMGPEHVVEMFRLDSRAQRADLEWSRGFLKALRSGRYRLAGE